MKIVVIGTRGIPNIMGGVETHCEELFPIIAEKGADVIDVRREGYVDDNLKEWRGVRLVDIPSPKNKYFETIVHTFRAVNYAAKTKADIVHIHAIGPALLVPYAKMRGLKVVFTHHGPDYEREKWGVVSKTILKMGEKLGCRFSDHIVVISETIKNLIVKCYGRTKNVHLIYNGVPVAEKCDYSEYFHELGIEKNNYIIGMCRFVPEKKLHDLLDSYIKLKVENRIRKDIRLVLAGDADFEDDYSIRLKQKAKVNDIVLTGFVSGRKKRSLLANAKCFVLPSSHEGLPIALLEAMSYNINILASDIPANKEIDLDNDSYFQCGNIQDLSDKLQSKIDSPFNYVEYDMKKYDWSIIANQLMEIYANMI